MFTEIKRDKSTNARAGVFTVNGYKIETPVLWLGHNFGGGSVPIWLHDQVDVPCLSVNACQILRKSGLTKSVGDSGIHNYLKYDGPIMMDSGGFLFQKHEKITVHPQEISRLYAVAGIDIGVVLDHPLSPSSSAFENNKRWALTLRHTETMASTFGSYTFMPVLHGYTLGRLERACQQIRSVVGTPAAVGLGSLVPLMKGNYPRKGFSYVRKGTANGNHLTFIGDALELVRDEFPDSLLHVFGIGGISTVLAIFALGADSVDSVAWRLKSAFGAIQLPGVSDRFLSPRPHSRRVRRVLKGEELNLLAKCNCPVCSRFSHLGWQKRCLDTNFKARTVHNALSSRREVRSFREAVLRGEAATFLSQKLSNSHRLSQLIFDRLKKHDGERL